MNENGSDVRKVILCNRTALAEKYGKYAVEIEETTDFIIGMDEERSISSCLILLDDERQMRDCRGKAVKDRRSREQNKRAVDAVVRGWRPDLITILGGPDIIPLQLLKNPEKGGDDILSDLPYACDSGYGSKLSSFLQPKRAISRLPDCCLAEGVSDKGRKEAADLLRIMMTRFSQVKDRGKAMYEQFSNLEKTFPKDSKKIRINRGTIVVNRQPFGGRLTEGSGGTPPAELCLFHGAAAYLGMDGKSDAVGHDNRLLRKFSEMIARGEMLGTAFLAALGSLAEAAKEDTAAGRTMARWMLLGDSSFRPVKKMETPAQMEPPTLTN